MENGTMGTLCIISWLLCVTLTENVKKLVELSAGGKSLKVGVEP